MAPKNTPISNSSTDEEQNSSSEGEEYTSYEDDGEENPPQPQGKAVQSTKSESETETETDSEPENEQPPPQPSAKKSVAANHIQEILNRPKPKSKSLAAVSTPSPKSTAAVKRGNETNMDGNNSKRAKKSDSDGVGEKSEDPKKQLFQRLFSEDDEVTLLEGLIEFSSTNGLNPMKDMNAFHDFIKKSMKFDASVAQLKDKIGRLRKKFINNIKRGKTGEDKAFSNAHERKTFNLSKQIWGNEFAGNGAESSVKPERNVKNTQEKNKRLAALKVDLGIDDHKEKEADKMENDRETKSVGNFNMNVAEDIEEFVLRRGLDVIDGTKKAEIEEEWRKLRVAELELFLQRNELIREQAKLLLDSYKR